LVGRKYETCFMAPFPGTDFEVAVEFFKILWTSGQWHRIATSNNFRVLPLIKLLCAIKKITDSLSSSKK